MRRACRARPLGTMPLKGTRSRPGNPALNPSHQRDVGRPDAGWTGRKLAKPSRGASKRREPSFKSGAGTLDVRLSPEDRSATPTSDAARARRSAKQHSAKPIPIKRASAKPDPSKLRIEPKVDL